VNEVFEKRRRVILEVRQMYCEVSYRQRMAGLARGDFDDEEEALQGLDPEPTEVPDEDVLESFVQDLDSVHALRSSVATHDNWPERTRKKWTDLANELERVARHGLGLDELQRTGT
jgi:hypothetical protein